MRKIKIFTYHLVIVLGMCSDSIYGSDLRSCVVSTYCSQVGIQEATGHNDGKEVQIYLKSCGLQGNYAWCAAFVNWVLKQCRIKTVNDARAAKWFTSEKTIYRRGNSSVNLPQPGDLCGFTWNAKSIQHIGFIDKWSDNGVITVEGNTTPQGEGIATREGDGVFRKRRLKRSIYVVANWIDK